jgi:hypothetical protein
MIWVYKKDDATLRTVQRPSDEGVEVLVVGSTGERARHTFADGVQATTFLDALAECIAARGFRLAWATGLAQPDPVVPQRVERLRLRRAG